MIKREKVTQREEFDCTRAAFATLMKLPYEEMPKYNLICRMSFEYDIPSNVSCYEVDLTKPKRFDHPSNWDDFFGRNGYKLRLLIGRVKNPPRFWVGNVVIGGLTPRLMFGQDGIHGHAVVMKRGRIWHDPRPQEGTIYRPDDVAISYVLEKL